MLYDLIDLLSTKELLNLPPREWLLKDIIPKEGLCGLVAPPESMKSFVALDWAMSISEGLPWQGLASDQAPVVYIAAEGGRGIQQRVRSWMAYHHMHDLPAMYWLLEPLYVREEGAVETFLDQLETADIWPGLLVVDTLSRSFGGGEENASADMGWFVERMTMLAKGRRMAALVVHHTNATGNRERGHTSFKGGLDTMFGCRVDRERGTERITSVEVINMKQKDSARTESIFLTPLIVGDSVVLERGNPPPPRTGTVPSGPAPMRKVDMLTLLGGHENGLTFSEWRLACGVPRRTFARRVTQLMTNGDIYKDTGRYYVYPSVTDLAELDAEEVEP